jgi:hypothetical protein
VIEKACFDIYLFDGKIKEKENLSVNIEQIGVFVQGRTEERRKNSPSGQTTHGAMFFCMRSQVQRFRVRDKDKIEGPKFS